LQRHIQVLIAIALALTLRSMSLLTLPSRVRRPRQRDSQRPAGIRLAGVAHGSPLPPPVRARVQLSADLVSSLLELEGRQRPTLDDLEWADALAARMAERQAQRLTASGTPQTEHTA
jgi:hypothetical protein